MDVKGIDSKIIACKERECMRKKASRAQTAEESRPAALQQLLTVADVASLLNLSRVTIYGLIKHDGLPTLKINGARRIHPGKLQSWIEQHSDSL
jgi:excisionase family DNA binding protein